MKQGGKDFLKNFRKLLDGNGNAFYILQNVKYNEQSATEHTNKTYAMGRAAGDIKGRANVVNQGAGDTKGRQM